MQVLVVMALVLLTPALPGSMLPMPAWENGSMLPTRASLFSPRVMAIVITALIVSLAVLTWTTPDHLVVLHNVLHHLNILPFMMGGLLFGWRGALKALVFACILQEPSIYRHWHSAPLDAQDQIVELSIFGLAGVIAGVLADRERLQRKRVEVTKLELEQVYTELRQNIEQLRKTERLIAAGELAASLAHEIRNPLASISGAAGILARGQFREQNREECLEILMLESQRLNKLLTNFLDFARPRLPRFQWTDPVSVIRSVITLSQHAAIRHDVELHGETPQILPELECDAEQIKQVLLNLIINAVQATETRAGKEGKVLIRSAVHKDRLRVEICDEGSGIAAEELDRVFDPFYTTKENGTGLGLSIAANIVAQHGGVLTCKRNESPEPGMTFRMELPLQRSHSPALGTELAAL